MRQQPETQELDHYLTPREAAALLRVSRSALYVLIARHELPHTRLGPRTVRLSESSLRAWMREREQGGGAR